MKHSSKPYNLKIANVFFKSGIMVLCKACDRYLELLRVDVHNHDQVGHDMVMRWMNMNFHFELIRN